MLEEDTEMLDVLPTVHDLIDQFGTQCTIDTCKGTDAEHIRGVPVLTLIGDNAVRIPWKTSDRIIMTAHCARHKLNRGNCGTLYLDDLIQRLGMTAFCNDTTYQTVLAGKLGAALSYCLERLHEDQHIVITPRKPHRSAWKRYTERWAEDGWDGDEDPPKDEQPLCDNAADQRLDAAPDVHGDTHFNNRDSAIDIGFGSDAPSPTASFTSPGGLSHASTVTVSSDSGSSGASSGTTNQAFLGQFTVAATQPQQFRHMVANQVSTPAFRPDHALAVAGVIPVLGLAQGVGTSPSSRQAHPEVANSSGPSRNAILMPEDCDVLPEDSASCAGVNPPRHRVPTVPTTITTPLAFPPSSPSPVAPTTTSSTTLGDIDSQLSRPQKVTPGKVVKHMSLSDKYAAALGYKTDGNYRASRLCRESRPDAQPLATSLRQNNAPKTMLTTNQSVVPPPPEIVPQAHLPRHSLDSVAPIIQTGQTPARDGIGAHGQVLPQKPLSPGHRGLSTIPRPVSHPFSPKVADAIPFSILPATAFEGNMDNMQETYQQIITLAWIIRAKLCSDDPQNLTGLRAMLDARLARVPQMSTFVAMVKMACKPRMTA